ncbi:hypothetical protein EDC96DRAFT_451092, partial [Choanephora cucurbitarum]
NSSKASGFSVIPLQQQSSEVTYSIDATFASIWPLKHESNPSFGQVTATAPVNTNHLAIGYDSGTICVVPLSLALLHLSDISRYIEGRDDVRVFEHAHQGAVTCIVVPERHVSDQRYLISGGQDGAVKIWNLM